MSKLIRKITVGKDYKNDAMHYAVGDRGLDGFAGVGCRFTNPRNLRRLLRDVFA